MIFEFDHISIWKHEKEGELDVLQLKKALSDWQTSLDGKGWNALYMENHDVPRSVSVFGDTSEEFWAISAKAIAMMYFFLQGTPFIYQGQEIGMTNAPFTSIEEIDAVDSKRLYRQLIQEGKSEAEALDIVADTTRDNGRTPMQWSAEDFAGFSTNQPWLMINPNYPVLNVEDQEEDPTSILQFYKKMIRIRRAHMGLIYGSFIEHLTEHSQVYSYERILEQDRYLVIVNLTNDPAEYTFTEEVSQHAWQLLLTNTNQQDRLFKSSGTLEPYEACLYKKL